MEPKQYSDTHVESKMMQEEIEKTQTSSVGRDEESDQMDDKELQRRLRRI